MIRTIDVSLKSLLIAIIAFGLTVSYPYVIGDYVVILSITILVILSASLRIKIGKLSVRRDERAYKKILIAFVLYGFWMFVALAFGTVNLNAIVRIIQFLGCFAAFYLAANCSFRSRHFELAHSLIKILLLICFVDWLLKGHPLNNYAFMFGNPNTFSSVLLCWFFVLSLRNNKRLIDHLYLLFILFLIFVSTSRASLLAALIYLVLSRLFRVIEDKRGIIRKDTVNTIFIIESVALIVFIVMYAVLIGSDFGNKLQTFSQIYFHKNFYSGRQVLWSGLLPYIKAKPIIGYGLSTVPADLLPNIHYSGHNTFLQIAIQMGVAGPILLLAIIRNIICTCASNYSNYLRIDILSFAFVIVFHECFEICLTQNMIACGLNMWFVLGLGCNYNIQKGETE